MYSRRATTPTSLSLAPGMLGGEERPQEASLPREPGMLGAERPTPSGMQMLCRHRASESRVMWCAMPPSACGWHPPPSIVLVEQVYIFVDPCCWRTRGLEYWRTGRGSAHCSAHLAVAMQDIDRAVHRLQYSLDLCLVSSPVPCPSGASMAFAECRRTLHVLCVLCAHAQLRRMREWVPLAAVN